MHKLIITLSIGVILAMSSVKAAEVIHSNTQHSPITCKTSHNTSFRPNNTDLTVK